MLEEQENQTQSEHENSFKPALLYGSAFVVTASSSSSNPIFHRGFFCIAHRCRQRIGTNHFELCHGHLPAAGHH